MIPNKGECIYDKLIEMITGVNTRCHDIYFSATGFNRNVEIVYSKLYGSLEYLLYNRLYVITIIDFESQLKAEQYNNAVEILRHQ